MCIYPLPLSSLKIENCVRMLDWFRSTDFPGFEIYFNQVMCKLHIITESLLYARELLK